MRYEVLLPDRAIPGQFGVYVALDGAGDALYIGRSQNLASRLTAHRRAPWHPRMRSIEFTPCRDINEARAVEKDMIETFAPAANQNDRGLRGSKGRYALPDWSAAKLRELYRRCYVGGYTPDDGELNGYIHALRDAGWKLAEIATALGMTREAIRLREQRPFVKVPFGVPARPFPIPTIRNARPRISDKDRGEMRRLRETARRVNGVTPADHPWRADGAALTELMARLVMEGFSVYAVAKAAGVTPHAVDSRLASHGYKNSKSWTRPYLGRPRDDVAIRRTTCMRDHPLSGDNVRLVNGDPARRVCRACERIRIANYQARKRVAA